MGLAEFADRRLKIKNTTIRVVLAEFLGTFILAFVGIGATIGGAPGIGGPVAGGLGVCLGIFAAANVSGGHINPAVTLGFFVQGRLGSSFLENLKMAVFYIASQIGGAFCAAALAHVVYLDKISGVTDVTCLFATCPTDSYDNNVGLMLVDQITGAWVLAGTVLAVTDPKNANPPGMAPLIIGLSATAVGIAYGGNAGGAINSARDFGPRCWAAIISGDVAFTGSPEQGRNTDMFFWIPLIGPLIGGAIAGLSYLFLIMAHWPNDQPVAAQVEPEQQTFDDDNL